MCFLFELAPRQEAAFAADLDAHYFLCFQGCTYFSLERCELDGERTSLSTPLEPLKVLRE